MATAPPTWLSASFVQNVLRNIEKDESIEVFDISVTEVTFNGENYASNIHRATVEFLRIQNGCIIQQKTSLIVKSTRSGDSVFQKLVESTGFFQKELSMMSKTLPRINEILHASNLPALSARCFHMRYKIPTYLVIEDLALKDFQRPIHHVGLDLDHCILAIRNVARFHASSIALKEKDPKAFTEYKKGLIHKDQPFLAAVHFNGFANLLANEVSKWPELHPRIAEKLFKLSNVLYEKGCEAAIYRDNEFNVLNHGDLWYNNLMFRYDERKKPIDHIFVDFQLCYYGSPALDVLHFFGRSLVDDVLHSRELLLREYYTTLTNTMAKLKCDTEVLSLDELKQTLKKRVFFEVFTTVAFLTRRVVQKEEDVVRPVANLTADYTNPAHCGKSYKQIMIRRLSFFDSIGLLDV